MKIKCCRLCKHNKLDSVSYLGNFHYTGLFPSQKTKKVPKGILALVKCKKCQLIQLSQNFNPKFFFGDNYGYKSSISKTMTDHLYGIKKYISSMVDINQNDNILDIGSNDGTLLKFFKNTKAKKLVGIDPSAKNFKKNYKNIGDIIIDFFSYFNVKRYKKFKVITSIAMFYDLPDPDKFVRDIKNSLDSNGVWYTEQFHISGLLKDRCFDSICHEHLLFLSLKNMYFLAKKNKLKILDVRLNKINGNTFGVLMSHEKSKYKQMKLKLRKFYKFEGKLNIKNKKTWIKLNNEITNMKNKILKFIKNERKNNKLIGGYGASTKGNVLLQLCKLNNKSIDYMIERDPRKFNKFTPGSKIKIISEKQAKKKNFGSYIVFPWHFKKEILKREEKFFNKGGKLIFPLPKFRIYKKIKS